MKKYLSLLAVVLFFSTVVSLFAQEEKKEECSKSCCGGDYELAQDSWSVGFGFSYPRYFSSHLRPLEEGFGGYISLQRDVTEHVAFRLKGIFQSLKGRVPGGMYKYNTGAMVPSEKEEVTTTVLAGHIDMIYSFVPVEKVVPFVSFGVGVGNYDPSWPSTIVNNYAENKTSFKCNAGVGAYWKVAPDWRIAFDATYNTCSSEIEGVVNNNRAGIFGSNATSYIALDLGAQYVFSKGAPSKLTQLYSGITIPQQEGTDYERIENIVKKYIPREVVKEVVVQVPEKKEQNWVLVGVKFDFNKTSLTNESFPILWHATQVLLSNPELNVEIQGYTDGVGSDSYNQKLSQKRAEVVKEYLVARGIDASRLTAVGYGKENPIGDNKTAEGRSLNRRIEFKVK